MPARLDPVPGAYIDLIEQWIDDGCWDDVPAGAAAQASLAVEVSRGSLTTGDFRPDPMVQLACFTCLHDLIMYNDSVSVRASGSGAGCGPHWPLCNGEVLPRAPALKTIVELSHRLTSGLALVFAIVLAVLAWRTFERGSRVRSAALAAVGLTVVEALIGAALVLFELVAHDASMKRAL
jgi:hypothetical protein